MAIPTALLLRLFFLLFLIIAAAAAAYPRGGSGTGSRSPGAHLIHSQCQLTHYYDLCVSSLLSHPGSSNVVYEDMGKLAVDVVFVSANDTRQPLSKMMRGGLDPASKQALKECGKQYDMAIYSLELAEKYMKSDGFKKTHDYNPVFRWMYNGEGYFSKCAVMLETQRGFNAPLKERIEIVRQLGDKRGFNAPLKERIEIVRQLGDNAYQILKWLIV